MLNIYYAVLYLFFVTSWSIVQTWVYNNPRGNVLMAILVHTSVDTLPNVILFPLFPALLVVTG